MRHGYHFGEMYMWGYGIYILIFILTVFVIFTFVLLKNRRTPNDFIIRLIDILKQRYAAGLINADEFIERKSIIQDIKYTNKFIPILLERYANCEISSNEFIEVKNEIESNNIDDITIEKLVKGELLYQEFKAKNQI
jgi:uncharacterized membrane protein